MAQTPGTWTAMESKEEHEDFSYILMAEGYGAVGYWYGGKGRHNDNYWRLSKEDAAIMSAAPELLEALEESIKYIPNTGIERQEHIGKMKAAIAKAKGK